MSNAYSTVRELAELRKQNERLLSALNEAHSLLLQGLHSHATAVIESALKGEIANAGANNG